MSMFNDISCGTKNIEQECLAHARVVPLYARGFGTGQWSFIGPGSEKKWYSIKQDSPQRIWDNMAEKILVEFAESTCPIFRATTPLSRGQSTQKQRTWPGGWGPQGMCSIGGGGLARVPNLRVCKHLYASGWHTQGEKDELTSCRGTV